MRKAKARAVSTKSYHTACTQFGMNFCCLFLQFGMKECVGLRGEKVRGWQLIIQ